MNHFLADDQKSRDYFGDRQIVGIDETEGDTPMNTKRVGFMCVCGFDNINAEAYWRAGYWRAPCANCSRTKVVA